jgi:hypothetical protein
MVHFKGRLMDVINSPDIYLARYGRYAATLR